MAKNNKPLLQEGTVRRMMKLANMEALGDGFISERYTPLEEEAVELEERGSKKGEYKRRKGHRAGDVDHHYKAYEKNENLNEDEESELEATEDELGAEDEFADEEGAEIDALEDEGGEAEVTITDEEAQDIIDLADKLRDAVGGEEVPEEEVDVEAEEEVSLEEPATAGVYEEELYEAALKGLNIDVVEDQKERQKALVQEVKRRIYKRVVSRLLKENKEK